MDIELTPKIIKDIKPCKIPQQTFFWGKLKEKQGYKVKAFDLTFKDSYKIQKEKERKGMADFLVILNQINKDEKMAYIPFGDYVLPDNVSYGRGLEILSEQLKKYLPDDCTFIRHEIDGEMPWAKDNSFYDINNQWIGPPEKSTMEMRMNIDTENWNLWKAPTDILPPDTVLLDLTSDENCIIKNMKQKTRYNIRLSQRHGVSVRCGGIDDLDLWYKLYSETALRNNIRLHDIDFFKTALETETVDPQNKLFLLIAELKGKPLAAMFLLITDKRATYLYGASSEENRNCMATYALQWQAIKIGRKIFCHEYDMFGISPTPNPDHPMYGLYRFKTGFGGKILHKYGCWDYPIDVEKYKMFKVYEMQDPGFHV